MMGGHVVGNYDEYNGSLFTLCDIDGQNPLAIILEVVMFVVGPMTAISFVESRR